LFQEGKGERAFPLKDICSTCKERCAEYDRWGMSEVKESSEKEKSEEEEKIISLDNFRKSKN
jgi:hypothetical protein